ncbi:MAG TPA: phosphatase PAP2 family protein [Sphingomicrobium sp.]
MNVEKKIAALGEGLLDLDDAARERLAIDDERLLTALHMFSKIGDQPQLRVLSGAVLAAGTFAGSDRLVRAGARMMLAHELATAAKDAIKDEVDRKRPRSADNRDDHKPRKGEHQSKKMTSFPSGHSAGAIAVARAFSREFPEYEPDAIGAALLIAASLIPRRSHYPTDIAAGLTLGLAAEKAIDLLWDAAGMDRRSETT